MVRVYAARTLAMAAHVRNVLTVEGIPCTLRNQFLGAGVGELPPIECWPEVWVLDADDASRAHRLIAEALEAPDTTPGNPWQCPQCGEEVEAIFARCWNCGMRV